MTFRLRYLPLLLAPLAAVSCTPTKPPEPKKSPYVDLGPKPVDEFMKLGAVGRDNPSCP